ncbi:MAG: hypothetical protein AAGG07_03035 [Planctomycetota bacterium]
MAEHDPGKSSDGAQPGGPGAFSPDPYRGNPSSDPLDVCDDLAELFLGPAPRPLRESEHLADHDALRLDTPSDEPVPDTEDRASDEHEDAALMANGQRRPPEIEALILGHLPVLAGMWVGHYAQHTAGQRGDPVGVVRRGDGSVQVRLYGTHETQSGLFGDLAAAIRSHAAGVTRWVLRVDRPDEAAFVGLDADRLTLLSTSDDAAVVASYRTLKGLASRFAVDLDDDAEPSATGLPGLRVVVIENAQGSGAAAASRLADAARVFLNRPIETVVIPAQLGRQPAVTLFDGQCSWADRDLIDELRATANSPVAHRSFAASERHAVVESKEAVSEPIERVAGPMGRDALAPEPLWVAELAAAPDDHTPSSGTTYRPSLNGTEPDRVIMRAAPKRETQQDTPPDRGPAEPGRPARSPEPRANDSVTRLVPGLKPLIESCPYEPGVVLATDRDDQLHALVLALGDGESVAAVRSLEAVRAWLTAHGGLVLRASGVARERDVHAPSITLHLLSTAPASVRRLLDADIALHAVTSVQTDHGERLGAVRLN